MATPIKMFKVTEDEATSIKIADGQIIFTTDSNKIYLDDNNKRECYTSSNIRTYVQREEPQDASNGDVWLMIDYDLKPFSEVSNAELKQYLQMHYEGKIDLANYWHVGDTRIMHLDAMAANPPYGSESHIAQDMEMVILDFNHDDLVNPINGNSKAAITIQCNKLLGDAEGNCEKGYLWGADKDLETFVDTDNYSNNPRRTWYNETFVQALPAEIQELVVPVKKKNLANHTDNTAGSETEDKAFALSYPEIFGSKAQASYQGSEELEGTQYAYYSYGATTWKNINNAVDTSNMYILRSPSSFMTYAWMVVSGNGSATFNTNSVEMGMAPAFCLAAEPAE